MAYFIDGVSYSEEEYSELREIINNRPVNTFETVYFLNHDTKMYEGRERTHDEIVDWFVQMVQADAVKLEEVPTEYRTQVEAMMPVSEEEQWANEIMEEVSEYGY